MGVSHHFYVCELLSENSRVLTDQLDVDLCLGVNQPLHGNHVHLRQNVLVLVQHAQFLHQHRLHLAHGLTQILREGGGAGEGSKSRIGVYK